MIRVVVLDDYQDVATSYGPWDDLGSDVTVETVTEHLSGALLLDRLQPADVIVAMRERTAFPAPLLDQLPKLRLLVTTGAGNASIDIAAAHRRGVTVCGTGLLPTPTAELTWGLILALLRHIPEEDRRLKLSGRAADDAAIRAGRWQENVGVEVAGKTLGIIGLGKLGQRVARVGLALDMTVIAWSQNLDHGHCRGLGVEPVGKRDLLVASDIVTLHLKLSDRTRGVIGPEEIALMRPTTYLVNTARGPLVDTDALVAALRDGRIAGAGIDVYDEEPLPADHPLRSTPNTVVTPHVGYVTDGTYRLFFADIVEDIAAWRSGVPIRVVGA